jgi:hypothetical protein
MLISIAVAVCLLQQPSGPSTVFTGEGYAFRMVAPEGWIAAKPVPKNALGEWTHPDLPGSSLRLRAQFLGIGRRGTKPRTPEEVIQVVLRTERDAAQGEVTAGSDLKTLCGRKAAVFEVGRQGPPPTRFAFVLTPRAVVEVSLRVQDRALDRRSETEFIRFVASFGFITDRVRETRRAYGRALGAPDDLACQPSALSTAARPQSTKTHRRPPLSVQGATIGMSHICSDSPLT